jgi:hypothetical protein
MLSLGLQQSVERTAQRSAIQCAARRKRGEAEAGWVLVALLLTMARLQSDVNMVEEMEQRRVEQWAPLNAPWGNSIPVVLLQPLTSEARSAPVYDGPMERLDAYGGMPTMDATAGSSGGTTNGSAGGPMRARKTKRMDRRLTHWRCVFCRHETRNDANATTCSKCDGVRSELRDADARGREQARRAARAKDAHGRQLNARGVGTETVPRAAQGVFERTRGDALVRWETQQLEAYTGSPLYLQKEDCNIGVMESFYIVHTGARVSVMDEVKRAQMTEVGVWLRRSVAFAGI